MTKQTTVDAKALAFINANTSSTGRGCSCLTENDCTGEGFCEKFEKQPALSEQPAPDHVGLVEIEIARVEAEFDEWIDVTGAIRHDSGWYHEARSFIRDAAEAIAALSRGPTPCNQCKGRGTEADYVGLEMQPVEAECSSCGGKGYATPPAPQQWDTPAADGWMCDGCGRLTKDLKRDFQDLRTLGRVSCCPERKMLPVKVSPRLPRRIPRRS